MVTGEAQGSSPLRTMELIAHLDRVMSDARKVGGEFCLVDIQAANAMLDRRVRQGLEALRERLRLEGRDVPGAQ